MLLRACRQLRPRPEVPLLGLPAATAAPRQRPRGLPSARLRMRTVRRRAAGSLDRYQLHGFRAAGSPWDYASRAFGGCRQPRGDGAGRSEGCRQPISGRAGSPRGCRQPSLGFIGCYSAAHLTQWEAKRERSVWDFSPQLLLSEPDVSAGTALERAARSSTTKVKGNEDG